MSGWFSPSATTAYHLTSVIALSCESTVHTEQIADTFRLLHYVVLDLSNAARFVFFFGITLFFWFALWVICDEGGGRGGASTVFCLCLVADCVIRSRTPQLGRGGLTV